MYKWVVSDNHFGHKNIIQYCNRPFKSVEEMDYEMIRRWNSVVQPEDHVLHLGDFGFGSKAKLAETAKWLNGKITLVRGNHDRKPYQLDKVFYHVCETARVIFEPSSPHPNYLAAHTPESVSDQLRSETGQWIGFHGHTHNTTPKFNGNLINMSVEHWDYTPQLITGVLDEWLEWRKQNGTGRS